MTNQEFAAEKLGEMKQRRVMEFSRTGKQVPASHSEQILESLLCGKKLTPIQAINDFECLRLSARIHDLRDIGILINTEKMPTKRGGSFARYSLVTDDEQI